MKAFEVELDRALTLLRGELQRRDLTQRSVQRRLGWGKNYLSELFAQEKALQLRQILAVLRVLGVAPGAFFAKLYGWPLIPDAGAGPPPEAGSGEREAIFAEVEREVGRVLELLRAKIEERGCTQVEIQVHLGWGAGYVSQLLKRKKALRFDQVHWILGVLGIGTATFYAELYAQEWERRPFDRLLGRDSDPMAGALYRVLIAKGLVTEEEVLGAMVVPCGSPGDRETVTDRPVDNLDPDPQKPNRPSGRKASAL